METHPELIELRATFDRVLRQELAAGAGHKTGGMVSDQGGSVLASCLATRSPVRQVTPAYGGIRLAFDDGALELRGIAWTNPVVQRLICRTRRRPWRLDRLVIGERSILLHFRRRRATLVLGVDAVADGPT